MVVGENGILNRATDANEKTKLASEKEAIELIMSDIKTDLMIGEEIPNEKYIGDKLSEMSAVTGDCKNVTVGENTYKDGWYLVEKGEEITGYGAAKLNWLINYDTGEIIELKEGEYTIANANASGAIVDETLKLNIDPVNLQNPDEWGDGVKFVGNDGSDEGGVKETEIKFDGVDDYLKIENVNVEKSDGITFEFYGKFYDDKKVILGKTYFTDDGSILKSPTAFRINGEFSSLRMCIGRLNCFSDLSEEKIFGDGRNISWLRFSNISILTEQDSYILFSVNFETNEIKAYQNGKLKQSTICSKEYLDSGDSLYDKSIPFTVGLIVQGNGEFEENYSKLDLYACRLYTRVLSDTEISQNYTATTNYHNELVK